MASRTLVRLVHGGQTSPIFSIPTFRLPLRQNLSSISTTTSSTDPAPPPGSITSYAPAEPLQDSLLSPPKPQTPSPGAQQPQLSKRSVLPRPTAPLSDSLALLPALAAQRPQYTTIHIHARPYMVTEGDSIRLPFLMPNAPIGTILRLNRATILGSRDFTFRGTPWVDEQYFVCRAIVTAIEQEPERVKIKKKQRNRRKKTVRSQHGFTVIRIMELSIRPEGGTAEVKITV